MNKRTKTILLATILSTTLAGIVASGQFASAGGGGSKNETGSTETIPLKETS